MDTAGTKHPWTVKGMAKGCSHGCSSACTPPTTRLPSQCPAGTACTWPPSQASPGQTQTPTRPESLPVSPQRLPCSSVTPATRESHPVFSSLALTACAQRTGPRAEISDPGNLNRLSALCPSVFMFWSQGWWHKPVISELGR